MPTPVLESGPFAGLPDTSSPEYAREHGRNGGRARAPRRDRSEFIGPPAGRPSSAHKAKAKALFDKHDANGGEGLDPDTIDNPQVREAYVDLLHEDAFGEKPSYRKEGSRQKADRQHREAIAAGEIPDDTQTPGQAEPGAAGGTAGTRTPSRPSGSSSSPSWGGGLSAGSDGTGLLFGFLLYALGLNYLRYGPAGITGWLSAKFLNKPNPALTGGTLTRTAAPTPIVNPDSGYSPGNGSATGGGRTGF